MSVNAVFAAGWMDKLDRMVPDDIRADPASLRAARQLVTLSAIAATAAPLLAVMYHFLHFDAAAGAVLSAGVAMALSPLALQINVACARDLYITALYLLKVWMALKLGGLSAPTTPWFLLCPLVAVLVGGAMPALAWGAIVFSTIGALFYIQLMAGALHPFPVAAPQVLGLVSLLGLVGLATVIGALFRMDGENKRAA